ncbi:zinc finger protein 596-like [Chelonus insularis]|uniref:zinc finger protein 596-like n=1 Tax=Chelonus insularis TaxID=460826 RepID=UPI00158A3BB4|nr:zinc finger protein 596-like [Chelonus insularis]
MLKMVLTIFESTVKIYIRDLKNLLTTEGNVDTKSKNLRAKYLWRPFPCHTCGKSYTRKDTLRRHLRYECGKNPQYICYVCKKGFKQKSNFQRHNLNVHGFRLYFEVSKVKRSAF